MERVLEALRAGKLDHLKPPKKDKGKAMEESSKAKKFAWQETDKAKSADVTINLTQTKLIKRMHVNTGSGVDIMYEYCYRFLPAEVKAQLRQPDIMLSGFSGEGSWPLGRIELEIKLYDDKDPQLVRSELIDFYVFPTMGGIATIVSHQVTELCGLVVPISTPSVGEQLKSSAVIANRLYSDKRIKIGADLSAETKAKLHGILSANTNVFAWKESDMTGVPRDIAEHRLNVNPSLIPVRQKKWHMALDRSDWLCAEVDNLVRANILREVRYQTWVANPVLVKKADGSWRMCVNFKDINKACPKDNYPLPEIDWKVESLSGFRYKCFLDAYKGYHQILMAVGDEDKTPFHTL
ncbi:uncharacterized protein [Rutidosis leptorrhynchoides]|uniref:uncharacterized protein n=1 Tax=Rutidosis leptorrhynchoides TaxID=125765 RepID=UPI003A99A850